MPYPITFLITDLISEIYGKKKANEVVLVGIFASIFSISILLVSNYVPAIENSPVDDKTFNNDFSNSRIAVLACKFGYRRIICSRGTNIESIVACVTGLNIRKARLL